MNLIKKKAVDKLRTYIFRFFSQSKLLNDFFYFCILEKGAFLGRDMNTHVVKLSLHHCRSTACCTFPLHNLLW